MKKQKLPDPIAIRTIELAQPLCALTDIADYATVKIFVNWAGRMLGHFELEHYGQEVSALRLRQAIADYLTLKVIEPDQSHPDDLLWQRAVNEVVDAYLDASRTAEEAPVEYMVDLSQPLQPLTNIGADQQYITVRVVWQTQTLGFVHIPTYGQPVAPTQLCEAIAGLAGVTLVWIFDFLANRISPLLGGLTTAILLTVIIYSGYQGTNFVYQPYADEGYRLGLALQQITKPGDLVVSIGSSFGDPVPLYYSYRRGWGFPPPALDYDWTQFPKDDSVAIGMFNTLRDDGADWFAIVDQHYQELWLDHPDFFAYLDQQCVFKEQSSAGVICEIVNAGQAIQAPNLPRLVQADADYVTQEIRYYRPDADAVSFVWGIDGWNVLPESLRPADTVITNKVMYTSMQQQGEQFVATVRVPAGTSIDYGFLVTQMQEGASRELWDAPEGRDYQTIAAVDQVIEMGYASDPPAAVAEPHTSFPLVAVLLWVGLGIVLLGTIMYMRRSPARAAKLESLVPRRWIYLRDLLRELVARDLKLRYRRSVLGFAWSLLNPLLQVLVFSFVFRYVLPLDIPNYTLYLFIGLLTWNWLQTSLLGATASIVESGNLIKRPDFPAAILPIVTISTNLIHFLLALPIVLLFLIQAGIAPALTILVLPAIVVLQFLFTLSLAYFLATLHVTLRDTQYLVNVALLLGFYLTPIFYDAQSIPQKWQTLYALNPILHLVNAYRAILLNNELPALSPLIVLAGVSVLLLYSGYRLFMRASYNFVEEL